MSAKEKVFLRAYHWETRVINGKEEIIAWCKRKDGHRSILRVKTFESRAYLELPKFMIDGNEKIGINWDNEDDRRVYVSEVIKQVNKLASSHLKKGPYVNRDNVDPSQRIRGRYVEKKMLYGLKDGRFIEIYAPSTAHLFALSTKLKTPVYVPLDPSLGVMSRKARMQIDLHEGHKLDAPTKYMTQYGLKRTQWLSVPARISKNPISHCDGVTSHEYYIKPEEAIGIAPEETISWPFRLKCFFFDFETYSPQHKNMPNARNFACAITDANYAVFYDTDVNGKFTPHGLQEYALVYGDVKPKDDGVQLRRFNSEKEELEAFVDALVEADPDVLSGYNIASYDLAYLNERMRKLGIVWPEKASRLRDFACDFYDKDSIKINPKLTRKLEVIRFPGRITLDTYHLAIRQYSNMPTQQLDMLAMKILKRGKHDVKPEEMFIAHEKIMDAAEQVMAVTKSWRRMTDEDEALFSSHHGMYPIFHSNVSDEVIKQVFRKYEEALEEKTRVSYYCDEDVRLCVDISQKVSMITNIIETASIMRINPADVYTRGEQIRGVAMIYEACYKRGVVMDRRYTEVGNAAGGHVGSMRKGYYKNVITLDFKSMYPSIIEAFNICYTTYVPKEELHLWKESDYQKFEWDQQMVEVTTNSKGRKKKVKLFNEDGTPKMEHHEYHFLKPEVRKGIIPDIVHYLVAERNKVKKKMGAAFKAGDFDMGAWYNIQQLAYKVSGNSVYGLMGVGEFGMLPFKIGSMTTAALGRILIKRCNKILAEEFGAEIVYNDTDSTMFIIPGVSGKDMVREGKRLEKLISAKFQDPLYFEFEKCGNFLGFTPKKYVYWLVDVEEKLKDGSPNPHFGELIDIDDVANAFLMRGNVMVRRDNCNLLKKIYLPALKIVLQNDGLKEGLRLIAENLVELLHHDVDLRDLVITGGINDNYSDPNSQMNVYFHRLQKMGKHVSRGDRVAFIIVKRDGHDKVADRMYPVDVFCEMREKDPSAVPDIQYYVENVLAKPLDKLLDVRYEKELVQDHARFLNNVYDKILTETEESLQKYFEPEETKQLMAEMGGEAPETVKEKPVDGVEDPMAVIDEKAAYVKRLADSTHTKVKGCTRRARAANLTGRKVLLETLTTAPIMKFAKELKKGREMSIMKLMTTDAVYKQIEEKLATPLGDWKISAAAA